MVTQRKPKHLSRVKRSGPDLLPEVIGTIALYGQFHYLFGVPMVRMTISWFQFWGQLHCALWGLS